MHLLLFCGPHMCHGREWVDSREERKEEETRRIVSWTVVMCQINFRWQGYLCSVSLWHAAGRKMTSNYCWLPVKEMHSLRDSERRMSRIFALTHERRNFITSRQLARCELRSRVKVTVTLAPHSRTTHSHWHSWGHEVERKRKENVNVAKYHLRFCVWRCIACKYLTLSLILRQYQMYKMQPLELRSVKWTKWHSGTRGGKKEREKQMHCVNQHGHTKHEMLL